MPLSRAAIASALLLAGCAGTTSSSLPAQTSASADRWEIPALPAPPPITSEEYARRRAALAGQMDDGVLLVMGSAEPEADYLPYGQNPEFRYLTGITEPGAALVISKRGPTLRELLFVLPRNPAREVWEGARLGAEGAQRRTGIPARPIGNLAAALDSLLAQGGTLYSMSTVPETEDLLATLTPQQQIVARLAARHPDLRVASLSSELQRLRGTKSPAELDRIRRAVYITNLAHRAAMRTMEPGMNEFEIQALVEYTFRRYGAERPSFSSIVGSGPNATTLHYRADDRFMNAGEVVVMDIGASYDGYAADVTRTIPVNGRFSPEQRAVYELVLGAQKAAEQRARPGATWQQLQAAADSVLSHGLARLGLIESPAATYACANGSCPQFRLFYMHGLGHGIGLEVHDPDASYFGSFRVGSAFTIEPGIYVRADALDHLPDTPENRALVARLRPTVERYRNIGVRIEDDYLITTSGAERITEGAPREIDEIEALMRLPAAGPNERQPAVVEWYRSIPPR